MKEHYQISRDRSLNISTVLKWYLVYWKAVLLSALAGAIILSAYTYHKEIDAYQQQAVAVTRSELETTMSQEEIGDVRRALTLDRNIQYRIQYLRENLLKDVDPYHENRLEILCNCEDSSELNNGLSFFTTNQWIDKLTEKIRDTYYPGVDGRYVKELMQSAVQEGLNTDQYTVVVDIILTPALNTPDARETLTHIIVETLSEAGVQVSDTSSGITEKIDQELVRLMTESEAFLQQMVDRDQELQARFSPRQTQLFQMYQTDTQLSSSQSSSKPELNIHVILKGASAGALALLLLIIFWLMLSSRIQSQIAIEDIWRIPVLGMFMNYRPDKMSNRAFFSKRMYQLLNRKYTDDEASLMQAAKQIYQACEIRDNTNVQIFACQELSKSSQTLISGLSEKLLKAGIELTLNSVDEAETSGTSRYQVLLIERNRVDYRKMNGILHAMQAADKDIIGALYVE